MAARGLLERRAHPEDGRVRLIHLTRKGQQLKSKLVPLAERIVRKMVAGVDEEALVTTRATLRRMFANLAD
jgi:DNA-binding MarR family transcriptional regulator